MSIIVSATPNNRRDLLVSHPGRQHSYEVAIAFERSDRLMRHFTGLFFDSDSFALRATNWLPDRHEGRFKRLFGRRSHANIAAERVRSWPYPEVLSRIVGKSPFIPKGIKARLDYPFVNWAFDRHVAHQLPKLKPTPSAVYGFLGSAEATLTTAKQLGITTILDVPIVLDALEILIQENASYGIDERPVGLAHDRMAREIRAADWIIVPSDTVAESLAKIHPVSGRVTVVPFGVDTERFRPANHDGRQPRNLRVRFAGRLEARKGIHFLIDAWRQAPSEWVLELAGSPGQREYVQAIRAAYGPNVREVGNLTQVELAEFLQSGDVFVFPSLAEGSALVVYQALAAGLPCIVTHESGSVVRDGVEGFIVPARDSASIAARLKLLAADSELRQRMGKAARSRAETYSWERYHRTLSEITSRMVEQSARLRTGVETQ